MLAEAGWGTVPLARRLGAPAAGAVALLLALGCTSPGDGDGGDANATSTAAAFRIDPVRPIAELRAEALAAEPPTERGEFRASDLVDLATVDTTFRFDIRYATADNFMGTPFYRSARAFLQRPAADALGRVQKSLKADGYGLLIHDAYRPWFVTKMFWEATPDDLRDFVADPARGSRHNRGAAVDLTLYELSSGRIVRMPSDYDEFTESAAPDYEGGSPAQRDARDLLRRRMEAEGFEVYEHEWWHFDYADWERYPIMNVTFEGLDSLSGPS